MAAADGPRGMPKSVVTERCGDAMKTGLMAADPGLAPGVTGDGPKNGLGRGEVTPP